MQTIKNFQPISQKVTAVFDYNGSPFETPVLGYAETTDGIEPMTWNENACTLEVAGNNTNFSGLKFEV